MNALVYSFLLFAKFAASFQKCCPIHSVIDNESLTTCRDPLNDLEDDLRGQFRHPIIIANKDFLSIEISSDADKCLDYAANGSLVMATKTPCHGSETKACILKCCPLGEVRICARVWFSDLMFFFFSFSPKDFLRGYGELRAGRF